MSVALRLGDVLLDGTKRGGPLKADSPWPPADALAMNEVTQGVSDMQVSSRAFGFSGAGFSSPGQMHPSLLSRPQEAQAAHHVLPVGQLLTIRSSASKGLVRVVQGGQTLADGRTPGEAHRRWCPLIVYQTNRLFLRSTLRKMDTFAWSFNLGPILFWESMQQGAWLLSHR